MVDSGVAGKPAGYRHERYAESFSELGRLLHLPRSNGWLLARAIPGSSHRDAMGSYPLFCCDNWSYLAEDLSEIGIGLVSVVLVTDPFGDYNQTTLESCFDNVRHFKDHYVVDLTRPLEDNVAKSNRATARRALRQLQVRMLPDPVECIDTWMNLFAGIARRQNLAGLRKFSRDSFLKQLQTPGAIMFEARADDDVVGLDMLYVDNDMAYGHACAFSELGYKLRASYATRWRMLEYLQGRVRLLDFGGSVGTGSASEDDGLAAYKRRWCATTKPVYLCTSVFNKGVYNELSRRYSNPETIYFPAYRQAEFT